MEDHVVVDVEIAKTIEQVEGGWNATDKLGVAVVCLWEYRTQRMRIYGPGDVELLRERLLAADRISGYNILNFDFPVIWGVNKKVWMDGSAIGSQNFTDEVMITTRLLKAKLLPKTNDLLRRIWEALGINPNNGPGGIKGTKLDDIAGATLKMGKIGNGADAPVWYQAGNIQKVANYCADDVALERDLTDYVDRYGYVIHQGAQLFLKGT